MKDFYKTTRSCIDKYNEICDKVTNDSQEISNDEDEYLTNFCLYLAHALIKDTGEGQLARDEIEKVADIINVVIR